MGKRTIVHVTKNERQYYQWTGKNAECCVMAIYQNGYVTDDRLQLYLGDSTITIKEYNSICNFDAAIGTPTDLEIIQKLAQRLKLKIKIHERQKLTEVAEQ